MDRINIRTEKNIITLYVVGIIMILLILVRSAFDSMILSLLYPIPSMLMFIMFSIKLCRYDKTSKDDVIVKNTSLFELSFLVSYITYCISDVFYVSSVSWNLYYHISYAFMFIGQLIHIVPCLIEKNNARYKLSITMITSIIEVTFFIFLSILNNLINVNGNKLQIKWEYVIAMLCIVSNWMYLMRYGDWENTRKRKTIEYIVYHQIVHACKMFIIIVSIAGASFPIRINESIHWVEISSGLVCFI